jgi:tetratricopeptide (TPR) repeat protein
MAENYEELEDYDNAELYADKCLKEEDTAYLLSLKADCLKEREDYEEAIKVLRKKYHNFDKTKDEKLQTLSLLIYNASNIYNKHKCERYINFAIKNFEPDSSLSYILAAYYEGIEDYKNALIYYKKLTTFDEDDATAYASLSFCYSKLGDDDSALKYADTAISKDSQNAYPYYRKGRIYSNMKEYYTAIIWFIKAIELDNTDVDSLQWISYCYSMLKDYEKSLEFANRAILLDNKDAYSYFRKAWAYQEIGRYQEAIRYYKDCINCNDKYVDAYLNISFIYSKMKDSKQSLLYANKALLINKDYAYAHYRKAWALQECGRLDEAYDGYSKAIELDPTDIYNYLGIACISLNTNDSSSALLYANKAIFIDRSCGGAYYYKSLALSNLGKIKESEAAYTKAIELGYVPVV